MKDGLFRNMAAAAVILLLPLVLLGIAWSHPEWMKGRKVRRHGKDR